MRDELSHSSCQARKFITGSVPKSIRESMGIYTGCEHVAIFPCEAAGVLRRKRMKQRIGGGFLEVKHQLPFFSMQN